MARQHHNKPWIAAIDHWLAGLIFALIVSSLVVCATFVPIIGPVFERTEANGIDAAMRARMVLAPRARMGREAAPAEPGYVFVDLDEATCDAVEHSEWCATRTPASSNAAALVAAAVLAANPKAVVLDVRLWDVGPAASRDGLQRLAKAIGQRPRIPVIAAAPFRPAQVPGGGSVETRMIPAEIADRTVFAPAYFWRADEILRHYPEMIAVRGDTGRARLVATLPLAAAVYAEPARPAAGCSRSEGGLVVCAERLRSPDAESNSIGALPLFSFPSLVPSARQARPESAATFQGLYDRYPSSAVVSADGQLLINRVLLANKIVVVGTSAPQAMDWHDTPLGEMCGPEVVINVIRAFSANAVLRQPSLPDKLLRECTFALIGSLPFLLYWLIAPRLREKARRSRLTRPVAWTIPVVLFPLTIVAAALAMIMMSFWRVSDAFLGGYTWDLYTPLAALSLEGFADAANAVSAFLDEVIVSIRKRLFGGDA